MAKEGDEIKQIISIEVKESGVDKASKDVQGLSSAIDETTDSTQKLETAQKSFKTQLHEANQELQNAVNKFGETSDEAVKAAKAVAGLKDQMGFAKDLADQFNPDQKMKALGAASQVAATGVSAVTSGMALFGDQSEDTQAALLKVQAAMAFSDSISGLSDLSDQWTLLKSVIGQSSIVTAANTAATTAASAVQKALGIETIATSIGFKVLKGAIVATGLGALAIAVIALVQNFDKVKEVVLNLVPGLSEVGEQIMGIVNAVTDFIGVTSEAGRAIDKQKSYAEKSLAQTEKYLKRHENTLTDAQKRELELRNEHFTRVKEGEFTQAESLQIYKEAKAKDAAEAAAKAAELEEKEREKAAEKAKAAREKRDAEAKSKREKEAEEKKKREEESYKFEQDRLKKLNDLEKASLDDIDAAKKANEDGAKTAKQVELDNEQLAYDKKLEAARKFGQDTEDLEIQHLNNVNDINLKHAEKAKEIDETIFNNKKLQQEAIAGLGNAGIQAAKDLFGKNKAVQKGIIATEGAVALGKVAINTVQAVAADNAASPTTFGLPWSAVHIGMGALGAASIIANTSKSLSAVGGGSVPSSGGSGLTAQSAPSRNVAQVGFQGSSENQIATSINKAGANAAPIQAFVVSSEIKNQAELDRKKELGNSI